MTQSTILVIHPQEPLLKHCRALLESLGYVVQTTADGAAALEAIYSAPSLPGLVVSGICLPQINGYQLCRVLKNDPLTRQIPVVLLKQPEETVNPFWRYKAGADGIVGEDEIDQDLHAHVQELLQIYGQIEQPPVSRNGSSAALNPATRVNQLLDKTLIERTMMGEFRNFYDLVADAGVLSHMIFSLLESLIQYDLAALFYNDNSNTPRHVALHVCEADQLNPAVAEQVREQFFDRLAEQTGVLVPAESRQHEVVGLTSPDVEKITLHERLFIPFHTDGRLIGAFALYTRDPRIRYETIFPIDLIQRELLVIMKMRNLYSRAEMLAMTDSLTGLLTYRHFTDALEQAVQRSKRYELDTTLAIVGIDHFRKLNAEWGYQAGDEMIRQMSLIARETFREADLIARFCSAEVAILFPETDSQSTLNALERFRKNIEEMSVMMNDEALKITVSIGISQVTPETANTMSLINQATASLKNARQNGYNRIGDLIC